MNDIFNTLQSVSKQSTDQVLQTFTTSIEHGLSTDEASKRSSIYGTNELHKPKTDIFVLFCKQFFSPFIIMLLIMGSIAILLQEYVNGIFIITGVLLNIIVTWFQEYKSASYLHSLKKYLFSNVYVKRDGTTKQILNRDLVPGDIVFLKRGDIIPADVRFLDAQDITIDQATLTGESIPVDKCAQAIELTNIYDAYNIGFMGSAVATGQATALVLSIGQKTYFGQTMNSLTTLKESQFLQKIRQFSYYMTLIILSSITLLFIISLLFKTHMSPFDLMIFSIALAISITPESLPAIVTFTLSKAIHVLMLEKVIIKQFTALQDLGSIELLCVDKTGTLTENRLHVESSLPYQSPNLLLLASQINNFPPSKDFDEALLQALSTEEQSAIAQKKIIFMRSFDAQTRSTFGVVQENNRQDFICIARGSFDAIIQLCSPLPSTIYQEHSDWYTKKSNEGDRVLAIASKRVNAASTDWAKEEHSLTFAGLISFEDPIKKTASEAITIAKKLGIIIKVISGDNKEVCSHVAKQLKLIEDDQQIIGGQEYATLTDTEKEQILNQVTVFAHMLPEQKLDLLIRLERLYITGYLGDGINDIPALNKANVAITVENASDMVRDAADIILLKKSLMPIIKGIKESRTIFANINKYMIITMTGNFGNFLSLVISSFIIPYLPMLPVQIIIINLLSDLPMLAIATDHVDVDELKVPKRFDLKNLFILTTIFAIISTIFDLLYFMLFKHYGEQTLQTGWFILNMLTEVMVIFSLRTKRYLFAGAAPSWILVILSMISTIIALALPYSTIGQTYFSFVALKSTHLIVIIGLTILYLIATESLKQLLNRKWKNNYC